MDVEATYTLVRAARELLQWDQQALAEQAAIGLATVRRFETGANVRADKIEAIVGALQKAGIAFLGPDSRRVDIKEGVALVVRRKSRKKAGTSDAIGVRPAVKAARRKPATESAKRRD